MVDYLKMKEDTQTVVELINGLTFDNFKSELEKFGAKDISSDFDWYLSNIPDIFRSKNVKNTNECFFGNLWAVRLDFPKQAIKKQDDNNWFYIEEKRQPNNTVFIFTAKINGQNYCYNINIQH